VYAVDVWQGMLSKAEQGSAGRVREIEFHHAGFLTYQYPEGTADAMTTSFAFHHLPDFWKGIALKQMNRMLKWGGQLYLYDVIMEESHAMENLGAFIKKQELAGEDFLREDAEGHFRDEFSTYDWVMDGFYPARASASLISVLIME
jgi:putative AdoMet-dependent methyltransferase